MLYYVKGILAMTDAQTAVVDCGGVGYKLTVSGKYTLKAYGNRKKTYVFIRIWRCARERVRVIRVYTTEEQSAFKASDNRIRRRAKAAMGVLSVLRLKNLRWAVSSGDAKAAVKGKRYRLENRLRESFSN